MNVRTLKEVIDAEVHRIQHNLAPTGLPAGLGLERRVPGGLPGDKITCLFADAGNFKTTVKNHMLVNMAADGHKVLDVSLEDSPELTADRYLARLSGVGYGSIAGGVLLPGEVADVASSAAHIASDVAARNIVVPDNVEPTADAILSLARATRPRVIAVDYVQLLGGYGNEKQVLDDAVRKFQAYATTTKTCVLLVSQQKQHDEGRPDPRPRLQDMLGSSAMRIGAKLVIGLFRPYNFAKAPSSPKGPYSMYTRFTSAHPDNLDLYPEILEAWVLKNVLGRTGAMHLRVHAETGVVDNFDDAMRPYLT